MLSLSHTEPRVFRLLPAALILLTCFPFQRQLQTDRLDTRATCVLRHRRKRCRCIKLSTGISPQWRFYRLLDIQKLLFVIFYDEEVAICLLCSTFAFEQVFWKSNTESVPTLRIGRRWRWDFSFLHRDCFLAFHDVLTLLSQLDLIFPWGHFVLAQMTSQWSFISFCQRN